MCVSVITYILALDLELILFAPVPKHNLILQTSLLNSLLEIFKWAQEYVVVIEVDRKCYIRLNKLDKLQTLHCVHGYHQKRHSRSRNRSPTQMHKHQVNLLILIPLWNLVEFIDHECITRDVDSVAGLETRGGGFGGGGVITELKHPAIDWRYSAENVVYGAQHAWLYVLSWHGGDFDRW